jgi:hypothetical protein
MANIEVGTEMCLPHYDRWTKEYSYSFSKVAKLTAKRATLENGKILNLDPLQDSNRNADYFKTFGDGRDYECWYFATPEIHAEQKQHEYKNKIQRWFDTQKFTFEEKEQIYNLLNNKK